MVFIIVEPGGTVKIKSPRRRSRGLFVPLVEGVDLKGIGGGGMIDIQLSQNAGKDSASLAHISAVFISKLFKHYVLFTSYPKYIDRNNNN